MDDLLTVRQIALMLKVHPLTIRRYIKEGKLKAVKVGGNVRVTQTDLRNFSEGYIAHSKVSKNTQETRETFQPDDPLFRLRGRGVSLDTFRE